MANSVHSMREQGYSVKRISQEHGLSEHHVKKELGIGYASPRAYSATHIGQDRDITGKFHKISTMKWVTDNE